MKNRNKPVPWSDAQIRSMAREAADLAAAELARLTTPDHAGVRALALGTLDDPTATNEDIGWAAKFLLLVLFRETDSKPATTGG